jgi:hypothetical protein
MTGNEGTNFSKCSTNKTCCILRSLFPGLGGFLSCLSRGFFRLMDFLGISTFDLFFLDLFCIGMNPVTVCLYMVRA